MPDNQNTTQLLNLDDFESTEDSETLDSSDELPESVKQDLLDAIKTKNDFFVSVKQQLEAIHSFPDQWERLREGMTLGRSLMEKVAEQQEAASNIIQSASYTSAIEQFAEEMKHMREAVNKSFVDFPQLTISPLTRQAIEDTSAIIESEQEDSSPNSFNFQAIEDLVLERPASKDDVASLAVKVDTALTQLTALKGVIATNTNVLVYCKPCDFLMAKVQFMMLAEMRCHRCGKFRNIPGKEVRIVMPPTTT